MYEMGCIIGALNYLNMSCAVNLITYHFTYFYAVAREFLFIVMGLVVLTVVKSDEKLQLIIILLWKCFTRNFKFYKNQQQMNFKKENFYRISNEDARTFSDFFLEIFHKTFTKFSMTFLRNLIFVRKSYKKFNLLRHF